MPRPIFELGPKQAEQAILLYSKYHKRKMRGMSYSAEAEAMAKRLEGETLLVTGNLGIGAKNVIMPPFLSVVGEVGCNSYSNTSWLVAPMELECVLLTIFSEGDIVLPKQVKALSIYLMMNEKKENKVLQCDNSTKWEKVPWRGRILMPEGEVITWGTGKGSSLEKTSVAAAIKAGITVLPGAEKASYPDFLQEERHYALALRSTNMRLPSLLGNGELQHPKFDYLPVFISRLKEAKDVGITPESEYVFGYEADCCLEFDKLNPKITKDADAPEEIRRFSRWCARNPDTDWAQKWQVLCERAKPKNLAPDVGKTEPLQAVGLDLC